MNSTVCMHQVNIHMCMYVRARCVKVNLTLIQMVHLSFMEVLSFVQIRVNIFIKHLIYSKAGFKYAYLLFAFRSFSFGMQ